MTFGVNIIITVCPSYGGFSKTLLIDPTCKLKIKSTGLLVLLSFTVLVLNLKQKM